MQLLGFPESGADLVEKMLEWTGERYIPHVDPAISGAQVHYEHLHRYAFAAQYVKGKKVLDLASGEGYGTFILSKTADSVVGIEIDPETVQYAFNTYQKENVKFLEGSILKIPISGRNIFDVIVCFEAIEHVQEHDALFREIKRLLKDDGLLIISTPNKQTYTDETDFHNPFHKKELYYDEFYALLKKNFSNIYIFGQKVVSGSSIYPISLKDVKSCSEFVIERENQQFSFKTQDEKVPLYYVAFASDKELKENKIQKSFLIDKSNLMVTLLIDKLNLGDIQTKSLEQTIIEKDQQLLEKTAKVQTLEETVTAKDHQLLVKTARVQTLEEAVSSSDRQLLEKTTRVQALEESVSVKDRQLLEKTARVQTLMETVTAKDHLLLEKTARAQALEETVIAQNHLLLEKTARAQALDEAVTAKDHLLLEKTARAQALDEAVTAKDHLLLEKTAKLQALEEFDQTLSAKDKQIHEMSLQVHYLDQKVSSIEKSIVWQCTIGFHTRIIEVFFPQYTRRRKFYDLGLLGGRVLINEGPRKLYSYYKERKRSKSHEKFLRRERITKEWQFKIFPLTRSYTSQIKFPRPQNTVEVSIIIPVYNKLQYTLNCLQAISAKTKESYEVIVVDDNSTDETFVQLKTIPNITVIKNQDNLGFVESCNKGARSSNGRYLLFLNNDTIITENWLPPLLRLIRRENVGAVGAKLMYPDGKLQEAGGVIWNDASAWNYGHGDHPDKPEYNFVRQVDYCSGAALLVKRELFKKIEGFDQRFIPAYYEDVDLCFSIQKMGYSILYQPDSVIVHFEGVSSGNDTTKGVKQNQPINQGKFLEKWKDHLQNQNFSPDPKNLFMARSKAPGKQILVIDQYVPFFDRDAGSHRMFNILKILVELGHKVTFIGDNFDQFHPYDHAMQQAGVEVIYSPFIKSIKQYLSQNGGYFNMVILSRPHIGEKYISMVRKYCPGATVIYDTVDLRFIRELRRAELYRDSNLHKKALDLKKSELQLAKQSDITLVVSEKEREILKNEDPSLNVQVISLIHEIEPPTKKFRGRKDIMFLGAFLHIPNVDSVLWFVREIFPKIKALKPDVKFVIVGDRPPREVISISGRDVIITGYVEDLKPYFNNCRVFVAPLRYGAGVKGKISQSMSHGLPVVTTSVGAEGMDLTDESNVLIADDPDSFSKKVIRLYDDEELWNKISRNSIEYIEKNLSYEASKKKLRQFMNSL